MAFDPTTTIPQTYICYRCGQTIWPDSTAVHCCPAWTTQPNYSFIVTPPMEAVNDHIACEPFKNDLTEVVQKGTGFNTMKGATTLTGLKVIFGNKDYPAGQTIYVRAEMAKEGIGKTILEVEGVKVVFIPIKDIKLVKRYPLQTSFAPNESVTYGKIP